MDENNGSPVENIEELKVRGLPEELKVFIKEHQVPDDTNFSTYLYRVKTTPGIKKPKRKFLEKLHMQYFEGDYDVSYIKDKYGGGEYVTVSVWMLADRKGKTGVENDSFSIEGQPKDPIINNKSTPHVDNGGGSATGAPNPNPNGFNMESLLKYLPLITAAMEAFKGLMPKVDTAGLKKIQEYQIETVEKVGNQVLKMKSDAYKTEIDKVNRAIREAQEMQTAIAEPEEEEITDASTIWPEWIRPFSPMIEKFADKMLGNNPLANGMRKLVVNNKDFQKCWTNKKKRAEAIEGLTKFFGHEVAEDLEKTFDEQVEEYNKSKNG